MAVIVPTYAYATGPFNVDGHNTNLYSTTATEGIFSEVNGDLMASNLDAAFQMENYHVWPEEAVRVRSDYNNVAVDYMSETETGAQVADGNVREELIAVAGCGLRFYVPYPCDILWSMGFFITIWRPHFGVAADQEDVEDLVLGDIRTQISMNLPVGSVESSGVIAHTKRGYPASVQSNRDTGGLSQHEDVACFYVNLHHLTRDVSKGWADIHLKLLLKNPGGGYSSPVLFLTPRRWGGFKEKLINHDFYIRATFGSRNAVGLIVG